MGLLVNGVNEQQTALGVTFAGAGDISAANIQKAIEELDAEKAPKESPSFTGNVSFSGDLYKNGVLFTGGAKGAGSNSVFYENDKTVTASYTITSGKNAMTAGPIEIADGAVVTIPAGSIWTIV